MKNFILVAAMAFAASFAFSNTSQAQGYNYAPSYQEDQYELRRRFDNDMRRFRYNMERRNSDFIDNLVMGDSERPEYQGNDSSGYTRRYGETPSQGFRVERCYACRP